jgi:hypothetical protein
MLPDEYRPCQGKGGEVADFFLKGLKGKGIHRKNFEGWKITRRTRRVVEVLRGRCERGEGREILWATPGLHFTAAHPHGFGIDSADL